MARIETGPIAFKNDWPGVFIRGDNALNFAFNLGLFLDFVDKMEKKPTYMFAPMRVLRSLENILKSCDIANFSEEEMDKLTNIVKDFMENKNDQPS